MHASGLKHAIKHEIDHEIKHEINHEIKHEINHEIKHEIDHEIKHEIEHEIKHEIKHEIEHEIENQIENEIENQMLNFFILGSRRVLVGAPLVTAGFGTCFGWGPLSYHWVRDVFWLGQRCRGSWDAIKTHLKSRFWRHRILKVKGRNFF